MTAERLVDPAQVAWFGARVPMARVGESTEIAEVIGFLLSDRASYVKRTERRWPGPPPAYRAIGETYDGAMTEPTTLVGVFDADGGLRGELRYVLDKLAGRGHCALCDITHGMNPLGKRSWKDACAAASLNVELLHRDEALPEQLAAADRLPVVLAGDGEGWRVLVPAGDLSACEGSPSELLKLIEVRLGR